MPKLMLFFCLIILVAITTSNPINRIVSNRLQGHKRSTNENESFPASPVLNTDLNTNMTKDNATSSMPIVKNVTRHIKRAGHGHKTKKEQSLVWSNNNYEPHTKKVRNWNYGNQGYQSQYSPQQQTWKNTGTAQQVNQPKDYSHLYYGANEISKPAADQISSGGYKMKQKTPWEAYNSYYSPQAKTYQAGSYRNQGTAQQVSQPKDYSHLYYAANEISKPAADQISSGGYKLKQKAPPSTYGNAWTQNKQASVDLSKYLPPAEKIKQVPAKTYQPSASNAQNWGYKGSAYQSNVLPSRGNSQSYSANQKSKATNPVASGGSSYHQPKDYSHLYYGSNAISKPAADQVYYGSKNNNRIPNSNVKSHQQWPSSNAHSGKADYSQYTGKHSLGYSNYYSHRKRRMDGNTTVSTTTDNGDNPSSTTGLGFIAEFFHEHIVGTTSNTATSNSNNDLQLPIKT